MWKDWKRVMERRMYVNMCVYVEERGSNCVCGKENGIDGERERENDISLEIHW